jgi:uncharacterized protein DUF4838
MIRIQVNLPGRWAKEPPVALAHKELALELPRLFDASLDLRVVLEMGGPTQDWKFAADRIWWSIDGRGNITLGGNHPRALLFATYAFLEHCGLRWLYPGEAGKRYPARASKPPAQNRFRSEAAFLHRGVATEGAFCGPDLVEFIEWMARQRLNHVFLQFESSRIFYRRANAAVSEADVRRWDQASARAILDRGLIYEKVGHDWLNKAFKFDIVDFHDHRTPTRAQAKILAQLSGRRDFFNGKPMFSQVCLSAPGVRSKIKKYFLQYCRAHPEVDTIAFWLGDGINNWCECAKCLRSSPSDQYVALVNVLAEALHQVNPKLKLEAICYTNFLEAPRKERLGNRHGNVIFAFAPYARNLLKPLRLSSGTWKAPRQRNRIEWPADGGYWRIFEAWRRKVDTRRCYVFDYYFAEQWLNESFLSESMQRDLLAYKKARVGGMISCQPIHQFFPHGANMAAMARLLWNPKTPLKQIWKDYFESHFGREGGRVLMRVWMEQSRLLKRQDTHGNLFALKKKALAKFRGSQELVWKGLRGDGAALKPGHRLSWMKYSDYWDHVIGELGNAKNAAAKGRRISEALRKALEDAGVPLPDLHKTARAAQVAIDGKL